MDDSTTPATKADTNRLDKRLDGVEARLDGLEGRVHSLEGTVKDLGERMERGFQVVHQSLEHILTVLSSIEKVQAEQLADHETRISRLETTVGVVA